MSQSITFGYLGAPTGVVTITSGYTVPSGYFAHVAASCKDGGSVNFGAGDVLLSSARSWTALASSNINVTADGTAGSLIAQSGSQTVSNNAFNTATAQPGDSNSNSFMVNTGTVIDGSGSWGALVTLYAQ